MLDFDFARVKRDLMWKVFRNITKFPDQQGAFMSKYVVNFSRNYLGMNKEERTLSTPSLLTTDSPDDEIPHLKVMNPSTYCQFGLIITPSAFSTKVYKPNADNILGLTGALNLTKERSSASKGMNWTTPSQNFMEELLLFCKEDSFLIKQFDEEFRNGVGQLFRVINNQECDIRKDDFKFRTAKVINLGRATFYSVHGVSWWSSGWMLRSQWNGHEFKFLTI